MKTKHRSSHSQFALGIDLDWPVQSGRFSEALFTLSNRELSTSACFLGSSGSGKSNLLLHRIAQDLWDGVSLFAIDFRGNTVEDILKLLPGRVDPALVKVIDLREKRHPMGFNPLHGAGEAYFRGLSLLYALASEADSWGVQLAETLRHCLLVLTESGQPLTRLEQLLTDRSFRLKCLSMCDPDGPGGFWERYEAMSDERQLGLTMPVLNKVSLLTSTKTMRTILSHPNPIDLKAQLDTPGSVTLVSLAIDEMHGAGRIFGKVFLSALSREVFARVDTPEHLRNNVRLILDEFEHVAGSEFESILAEARKFKLSLIMAFQSLAQTSPRLRSLILGNVGVKVVFRLGREDSLTMSKDLFGSPSEFDFTTLPTGRAVAWKRSGEIREIEVNPPVLTGSIAEARRAKQFLELVYAHERIRSAATVPADRPIGVAADNKDREGRLDDWLAG